MAENTNTKQTSEETANGYSMINNAVRAEVISHSLPYIQKYYGKVVVVKYGGNAMTNATFQESVMRDIALLNLVGVKVVLVHGGGPELEKELKAIGKKTEKIEGLRVTDDETAQIAQMVLGGKVNKNLVNHLNCVGAEAMGICGIDGSMIIAEPLSKELGFVGRITHVNPDPIKAVINAGYVPVIAPIGSDEKGNVYNINADTAASSIAAALEAECLILMTNTAGVLEESGNESSLISFLTAEDMQDMLDTDKLDGGMIPKAICTIDALNNGVNRVFIIDGTVPQALLIELMTDEGIGTLIKIKR